MQLLELVIMSSGINRLSMFFSRFKGYHNICQSSPFSNQKTSVAGRTFHRKRYLISPYSSSLPLEINLSYLQNPYHEYRCTLSSWHIFSEELELAVRYL